MNRPDSSREIHARFRGGFEGFNFDVDLRLPGQGVTALFGPSGCGKTTLLRCIAGLLKVKDGELTYNGSVWQDAQQFLPTHRRALGYVFQDANLFPHLDVRGNLAFGERRVKPTERHIRFDEVIELLGLEKLQRRMPQELSGGQKQRVAIARALLTSPQLLLMDEPLANLDLQSRAEILPWLQQLRDRLQIPVIYVSHAPAEVAQLADHLVLLQDGRLVAAGPVNEMLTRADLPLAQLEEASAVVHGHISGHDYEYHLTHVAVPGGYLSVAHRDLPINHPVRVRILARDVSVALDRAQHTSITNILSARVIDLAPAHDLAQALLRIDLGGMPILARITRRSAAMLDLQPGRAIYAQVKSVALMGG